MRMPFSKLRYVVLLTMAVASFAACDSVVEPGNHAAGVVFLRGDGTEAARFIYQGTISGGLTVSEGGSATYRVRLVTGTGDIEDVDGLEYSLEDVRVGIPLLVTPALQGEDRIVLNGLVAGETAVRFYLEHGGHTEFEIRDVPVEIQQDS